MVDIREQLAAYAHEAWSGWMRHFFGKCSINVDGDYVVPAKYVMNLWELIGKPYAALSEEQKDNDRQEADRMLAIMRGDDDSH